MKCYFVNDPRFCSRRRGVWDVSFFSPETRAYRREMMRSHLFLPADCLFLGGDLGISPWSAAVGISYAATIYEHVFVVYGDQELVVPRGDVLKGIVSHPLPRFGVSKTFSAGDFRDSWSYRELLESTVSDMLRNLGLDNVTFLDECGEASWRGLRAVGRMCFFDGAGSAIETRILEYKWRKDVLKKIPYVGIDSFKELADREAAQLLREVTPDTDIVCTHFPPIQAVLSLRDQVGKLFKLPSEKIEEENPGKLRREAIDLWLPHEIDARPGREGRVCRFGLKMDREKLDIGLISFDGSLVLDKLKSGAIWHFGHLKRGIFGEVEWRGKKILFISNPAVSPIVLRAMRRNPDYPIKPKWAHCSSDYILNI